MTIEMRAEAAGLFDVAPALVRAIQRHARDLVHVDNLTLPQYRVMHYLATHGRASVTELADWRDVSLAAMSKMVSGLVERNLVHRYDDPNNRRVAILELTGAGCALHQRVRTQVEQWLSARLNSLGVEHVAHLVRDLQAVTGLLDEDGTPMDTRSTALILAQEG